MRAARCGEKGVPRRSQKPDQAAVGVPARFNVSTNTVAAATVFVARVPILYRGVFDLSVL